MEASLAPLEGKYYGTKVIVHDEENFKGEWIMIWVMGNYEPSRRELEGYEKRDGKWMRWEPESTYQGVTYPGEWYEYEVSDTHYESETGLRIAELLVEAINGN